MSFTMRFSGGYLWRIKLVIFSMVLYHVKLVNSQDIVVGTFDPGTYPTFVKNTAANLANFQLSIKNAAISPGNQISISTTTDNYKVNVYLAQDDLATNSVALKTAAYPATLAITGNLKVGLAAGATTSLQTLNANGITLPNVDCNKYTWLCAEVVKVVGALYIDANTNNNYQCKDATAKISCSPDITVINFDPSAGTFPVFNTLVGKDLVSFKVDVKNSAPVGAGNQIEAAPTGNNYEIEIFMATDDLAVTPTATAAGPFAATLTSGDLTVGLAPGAPTSPSLVMKATGIKLPALLNCNDYKWICACVKKGTGAQYIDEITDNNCQCADASKKSKIDCPIDVLLASMTLSPPYMTTGKPFTIPFSVDLKNDDIANDITPASTGGLNFECIMRFAATDIGSGKAPTPDNLAAPTQSFNSDCIQGDPNLKSGLNSKKTITLTGSCDMTLSNTKCKEAKFLCLDCKSPTPPPTPTSPIPPLSSTYTDKILNNNIMCKRVDSKLTCDIDISLDISLPNINEMCTKLPDPFLSGVSTSVLITKLTVKNNNLKSPGSALNDIKANTDTFAFDVVFSSDVSTVPKTLDGSTVSNVAVWNDALKATKKKEKDQSITFQMTDADCPTMTHICLKVRGGTGAVFNEVTTSPAKLDDNTKCCSIAAKKLCKPDVYARTLTESGGPVTFQHDVSPQAKWDFTLSIKNIESSGSNIKPATDNFKVKCYMAKASKVKIGAEKPATLTAGKDDGLDGGTTADAGYPAGGPPINLVGKVTFAALSVADCTALTEICCIVEPGGAVPAYTETNPTTNNEACTTTITKYCEVRPQWDMATFKPVNINEDVTLANPDVITLTAIDVDSPDLIFLMQCNPVTNIFNHKPPTPPATGKKMTITHKAKPGFDLYETPTSFTCYVFVTDGLHPAVMGTVTINIDKKPVMNLPISGIIFVPELHCYGCHLYDFQCTAPVAGQTVTKTFSVYDTPFDLQAKSKFQLDSHGRVLLNFENNILYTRVKEYKAKFTCCSDSTDPKTRCAEQNITIKVEQMNREPLFRPNSTGITIKEDQSTDDLFDVDSKFFDPEGKSPSKCVVLPKRYEKYFEITSGMLKLKKKLDYDTYTPPHHFYISISCEDSVSIKPPRDGPAVPKLSTEMLVEVNILGVDDNEPKFLPTTYSATVFEDAFSSQSILRVHATDADLGEDGQMTYSVNPSDPNVALANQLFQIVQISNEWAEIRCRGGLDVEKYSSVVFQVIAVSKPGDKTGTATVTVYIRNVNDLRPQWVTPDYINLEISTTAKVDKLMTTLSCKDTDILYNTVNYDQISVTFGGSDYFKTNVYNGEVRSNHTPYEEDNRYFVRVVCKDTDPKEDFSGIAIVRIDTYVNWKHVTNWTMCKPMGNYTAADKDAFLASVATLCPPCIPKIHNITEKDGQAVFHLYFIEDNTTYAKNAREYDKKFIETDTILERYHNETSNGPKKSVKDDPVFNGCLVNITRFADEPMTNWFLDTIQGNFMLGILMSLAYGLLMAAIICTVRKAAPGRMRIPVTPKGRAPKKVNKPQATPKKKPEEKKRPKTPESEYSDESEATYREPTPKIRRRESDKFV